MHHSLSPVPTPNTLSVQVPHAAPANQGQSLPNLLSIAVPVPVNPQQTTAGQLTAGKTGTSSKSFRFCFVFISTPLLLGVSQMEISQSIESFWLSEAFGFSFGYFLLLSFSIPLSNFPVINCC